MATKDNSEAAAVPRPRLRHGGQRRVLDSNNVRELHRAFILWQCAVMLSHIGTGELDCIHLVLRIGHVLIVKGGEGGICPALLATLRRGEGRGFGAVCTNGIRWVLPYVIRVPVRQDRRLSRHSLLVQRPFVQTAAIIVWNDVRSRK